MSFSQNILKTISIGDIKKSDCSTQLYKNCECSENSLFIGATKQQDYYTFWSFIGFIIATIIITVLAILDSYIGYKSHRYTKIKNVLLPIGVSFIVNSLTVGFTSNLLFTILKIDTPEGSEEPNAMDFNAFKTLNDTNFIFHVLPAYMTLVLLFGIIFININTTFWSFYIKVLLFQLLFYFVWMMVPVKVVKDYNNVEETVFGLEKIKYTYSDPTWYIILTFIVISIVSGILITLAIIKNKKIKTQALKRKRK